ncbi:MAG: aspartate racemase [Alphaproteobacteria bacterium PA4]|nr:MAG: aspartate racemase [Alphaproteobacteria bacterium PA4]
MHIGLIGGIGPAATDHYYRRLVAAFAARGAPLDMTIVHADAPTLLANLAGNAVAEQVAIYARVTARLAAAGADCVAVTSIAGHFCIRDFAAVSPLPIIDMVSAIESAVTARGLRRIGILGTRTVMATRLYGSIASAEIVPPRGAMLDQVHTAYTAMATAGAVTAAQRAVFLAAARQLLEDDQVDAIMLGGTDLALAFDAATAPFPLVDCAGIHVDAIVARALG